MKDALSLKQELTLVDRCPSAGVSGRTLLRANFAFDEKSVEIWQRRAGVESDAVQTTGIAVLNQIATIFHSVNYWPNCDGAGTDDSISTERCH